MNTVFRALNDPLRREIIEMLKERNMNAGEIAERFTVAKSTISHHLDILRQADLVTSQKDGQFIIYSLNTTVLDELIEWILNIKNG